MVDSDLSYFSGLFLLQVSKFAVVQFILTFLHLFNLCMKINENSVNFYNAVVDCFVPPASGHRIELLSLFAKQFVPLTNSTFEKFSHAPTCNSFSLLVLFLLPSKKNIDLSSSFFMHVDPDCDTYL